MTKSTKSNNFKWIMADAVFITFICILVSFMLYSGYYNPNSDMEGIVTGINFSNNSFVLYNTQMYCPNIHLSILHVGEIVEVKQPHIWPFDNTCTITKVSP